jgi:hypothetical protein
MPVMRLLMISPKLKTCNISEKRNKTIYNYIYIVYTNNVHVALFFLI